MQMAEEDSDITSSLISEVDGEEVGLASSRFTGATGLGTVKQLNLINLAKLCIKRVIEFTSTQGMSIDDFSPQIQELFILLESCMRHRLKGEWACPRQVAWRDAPCPQSVCGEGGTVCNWAHLVCPYPFCQSSSSSLPYCLYHILSLL